MRATTRHIAIPLLLAAWGMLLLGGVLHDLADHHDEIASSCESCLAAAHAVAPEAAVAVAPVLARVGSVPEADDPFRASPLDRDHPVRAPPVLS